MTFPAGNRHVRLLTAVVALFVVSAALIHGNAAASLKYVSPATKAAAEKLMNAALSPPLAGLSWNRLAEMTDTFGPRLSGSAALENSIDWIVQQLQQDGFENVHTENVMVPRWERGQESLQMLLPRQKSMALLGLGTSVGTGGKPIEADVLVVCSFDELKQRASEAQGKIVVYNQPFVNYGTSAAYRSQGASEAAKVGAIAALVRSVTPLSLYTPHTGVQHYAPNVTQIPVASITVEDAELLWRIQQRGKTIRLRLSMEAQNFPEATSRNIVADITGYMYPDQVVVVSGHIDSWDVGAGAQDDGGPSFSMWQILKVMRSLGLRAKRTIRLILWTCEEFGGYGGEAYYAAHKDNISKNYVLAIEADLGAFPPTGYALTASSQAIPIIQEIALIAAPLNATMVRTGGGGVDIGPMGRGGIPMLSPTTMDSTYFWFHHTNADTMTAILPENMDKLTAAIGVMAFSVADLKDRLPK